MGRALCQIGRSGLLQRATILVRELAIDSEWRRLRDAQQQFQATEELSVLEAETHLMGTRLTTTESILRELKAPETRGCHAQLSDEEWDLRFQKLVDPEYYTRPYHLSQHGSSVSAQSTLNGCTYGQHAKGTGSKRQKS